MDPNPDDLQAVGDLELLRAARHGDRLAFGLLYLRHHAAAWRVACVTSRFSPDAELALIEGFTRIFSALPENPEESGAGGVSFRPYLLACVRQAALDRARVAGRSGPADAGAEAEGAERTPELAPLAGLGPDGEIVLSGLEHDAGRGALAALDERARTALWLTDVEAMTPAEVAGIVGEAPGVAALVAGARAELDRAREAARHRHEVRAECRFAADHLEAYRAAALDPADGVAVRAHLDECPPCRMRHEELTGGPAALAAAVPDAPLLGGEAQHHWLAASADLRPAARLLPPGAAAAGALHRSPLDRLRPTGAVAAGLHHFPLAGLPRALRRAGHAATSSWRDRPDAIDLTDPTAPTLDGAIAAPPDWTAAPGASGSMTPALPRSWRIPARRASTPTRPPRRTGGKPGRARRLKATVWPALPAAGLSVAWVAVMLALPWLMTPKTAQGPDGEALPAVQAYVPDFLPGATGHPAHQAGGHNAGRASAAGSGLAGGPSVPGAGLTGEADRMSNGSGGANDAMAGETVVGLVSAVAPHRARPLAPARPGPVPVPAVSESPAPAPPGPAAETVAATTTGSALTPAAPIGVTDATGPPATHPKHAKPAKHGKRDHPAKPDTAATVPDRPAITTTTTRPAGRPSGAPGGKAGKGPRIVTA